MDKLMIIKKLNYNKLMAKKPTHLGQAGGHQWYEHPTRGDEAPLIAVKNGEAYLTEFWEMEDVYIWAGLN